MKYKTESEAELKAEVKELRKQLEETEAEIDKMAEIQQTLLPETSPNIVGLDIASSHVAPEKAGGDYYDFVPEQLDEDLRPMEEGNWLAMVADVSGHGPAASVIMAMVHSVLHAYDGSRQNPGDVLTYVNEQLTAKELEHFVTGMLIVINPKESGSDQFCIAVAGHHPPLIRRVDGTVEELDCKTGLPLAVEETAVYEQTAFSLAQGESMLIYTDGLIEPTNPEGEEFGMDGLTNVFMDCAGTSEETIRTVNRALMIHRGGEEQLDDKTLIVISKTAN